MSITVNRRDFIAWLSASAALAGCKKRDKDEGETDETDEETGLLVEDEYNLDVWYADMAMALEVLRASEDHLAARAGRLIAAKDAAGIHALVQQELRLIPVSSSEIADVDLAVMHWGPEAALRSGAGTAREQGELLQKLYQDAGFEAELYGRRVTLDEATLQAMLTAGLDRDVVPELTAEQEARLRRAPGMLNTELLLERATEGEAKALADTLAAMAFVGVEADFAGGAQALFLPVVKVMVNGSAMWADPLLVEAAFGELISDDGEDGVYLLDTPAELPEVEVQLMWSQASDSRAETVLVEHTWAASELVGKSLSACFVPVAPVDVLAFAPKSAIQLWQPVLAIDGATVASGSTVSVGGERVEIDVVAGTMSWGGKPLGLAGDAALAAQVATVSVSAHAGSFPDVRLRVGAYDASGDPVEGLAGAQFVIEEEGERVGAALTANLRAGRRVLIVADNSGSVDPAFLGDAFVALVGEIYDATALVESEVRWAVAPILFGAAPQGEFTADREALLAQATGIWQDGSELWAALGDAGRYDADVVILISDGLSNDTRADVNPAALSSCPQVIAVHATLDGSGAETMAEIVGLLGGVVLNPSEVVAMGEALAEALAGAADSWYQLDYSAYADGPSLRNLTVKVGTAPAGATSYEVPELPVVREIAPVSVRLRVRVGEREVTRVLVGLPQSAYAVDDPELLAKAMAEVRDSLGMGASLCFDGPGATFAQAMDQFVAERLGSKAAAEWVRAQRPLESMTDELGGMPSPRPSASVMLLQHAADPRIDGVVTAPLGIQVVMERFRMQRTESPQAYVVRTVDLLPLTPWAGVGATGQASRRATLEACLRQGMAEGALPGSSTLSALAGQVLVLVPAYVNVEEVISGLSEAERVAWAETLAATYGRVHLVPASGAHLGAWAIDAETGALLGLLPGGAGGSENKDPLPIQEIKRTRKILETYLAVLGITGSAAGASPQMSALIAITVFHVRMWSIAAIMIESLTVYSSEMSDKEICEVERQVDELVCSTIRAFLMGPYGMLDAQVGALELFAGAAGGSSFCEALTKAEKGGAC